MVNKPGKQLSIKAPDKVCEPKNVKTRKRNYRQFEKKRTKLGKTLVFS